MSVIVTRTFSERLDASSRREVFESVRTALLLTPAFSAKRTVPIDMWRRLSFAALIA